MSHRGYSIGDAAGSMSTSIIIRTEGRRPQGLRRAVASALQQSVMDVRVIVVGDGVDPALQLQGLTDARLQIVARGKCGRSAAGNAGCALVQTPLLGFLDDDDELFPQHVATMRAALDAAPDAVAAYGFTTEVAVRGVDDAAQDGAIRLRGVAPFCRPALWIRNYLPIQSVVFRRDSLAGGSAFDETLESLEDWDLWLRLSRRGAFIAVPEVTSRYRIPGSKAALERRAREHGGAYAVLARKYADTGITLRFEEFRQLDDYLKAHLDDMTGFRYSLGRIWRRLRQGH